MSPKGSDETWNFPSIRWSVMSALCLVVVFMKIPSLDEGLIKQTLSVFLRWQSGLGEIKPLWLVPRWWTKLVLPNIVTPGTKQDMNLGILNHPNSADWADKPPAELSFQNMYPWNWTKSFKIGARDGFFQTSWPNTKTLREFFNYFSKMVLFTIHQKKAFETCGGESILQVAETSCYLVPEPLLCDLQVAPVWNLVAWALNDVWGVFFSFAEKRPLFKILKHNLHRWEILGSS